MKVIMLDETHEQELIERARKGDQRAFEEIFGTLRERLLATIRIHLGPAVKQRLDPEDVLQDTFIRAYHSLERFEWRGKDTLRRWLESIATHVALDEIRHHGRRKLLQIDRDTQGTGPTPSKGLRRVERFERLKKSMERLSEDYQTVLRLSRMECLPLKEVARRMGRSESAIKNLLLRATRELKRSFGDTESLSLGNGPFEETGGPDGR